MKNIFKFILLIIILITGFVVIRILGINHVNSSVIRDFILSFGWKAPILYIVLYTIRPIFLFPASLLSLTGGLTFGPVYGTCYDMVGASLGAYLSFFLSRKLGMETVQKWTNNRFKKIDYEIEEHGFRTIIFLRLIPLFPFDGVSYAAGLSKVRFIDFALGTTLGIIPGAFAYNFLGSTLHNPFSQKFYIALAYMAILIIIPLLYKKLHKRKG